jgi:hypothetical protein
MARSLAIVRGHREVADVDYLTTVKIGLDCLPAPRRRMIDTLSRLRMQGELTPSTTAISEATRYPTSTARRYLAELHAIGFVDRAAGGQGRPDNWMLSEEYHSLIAAVTEPIEATAEPATCSTTAEGV